MESLPPVQRLRSSKRRTVEKQEWMNLLATQKRLNMNATYSQSPRPNKGRCRACAITQAAAQSKASTNTSSSVCPKPKAPHTTGSNSSSSTASPKVKPANSVIVIGSPVFGDNKGFLQAFQVLETLSKLVKTFSAADDTCEDPSDGAGNADSSLPYVPDTHQKAVICSYEKLHALLKRRCILALKKECVIHIQDARSFVVELRTALKEEYSKFCLLHSCQKTELKQKTLERFYLCRKNSLLEDLQKHMCLWSSVVRNVSRIVAIFHMEKDGGVESLLTQTHMTLNRLQNEALYYVHKILQVDLQIVCCIEPFSVPYETLQHLFHVCDKYTELLLSVKENHHPHCWCGVQFACSELCLLCSIELLPLSFILKMLASHQAMLASDKMSAYLMSEARRECKTKSKTQDCTSLWLPIESIDMISNTLPLSSRQRTNETSDYYSASTSERDPPSAPRQGDIVGANRLLPIEGSTVNLPTVLGIIVQCNQTLLLKYLFAFTNTSPPVSSRTNSSVSGELKTPKAKGSRSIWQIPTKSPGYNHENSRIEYSYWHNFWDLLILRLSGSLLITPQKKAVENFLPCGTLLLCPRDMLCVILRMLREATTDPELSPEAIDALHEIHWTIFSFGVLTAWNESISLAISNIQLHRLSAIPLVKGGACTTVGNALFSAFGPLVGSLTFAYQTNYLHQSHLTIMLLNVTLDVLISWVSSTQKGLLFSWNIPLYLLMSCSDLKRISDLINKVVCVNSLQQASSNGGLQLRINHSQFILNSLWGHFIISSQIIQDYQISLPSQLLNVTSKKTFELLTNSANAGKEWKRYKSGRLQLQDRSAYVNQIIRDILRPVVDTATTLPATTQEDVVNATLDGIALAWTDFLLRRNVRFSLKGGQQFERDVLSVCGWIDDAQLCSEEKERILTSPKVLQLCAVAKLLAMPNLSVYAQQPTARRNQVVPSASDITTTDNCENINVQIRGIARSVRIDPLRWIHLRSRSCFADICCSR